MSRLSITALVGVILCVVLPFTASGQSEALPDGAGKQMVEGVCTGCHKTNLILGSSGYTRRAGRN